MKGEDGSREGGKGKGERCKGRGSDGEVGGRGREGGEWRGEDVGRRKGR